IAFSTAPDHPATVAFVAQDGLISVLDVATGRPRRSPYDVRGHPGLAGVTLRGLATSRPRWFDDPTGGFSVLRNFLFAAATLPSGEAHLLVFDQLTMIEAPGVPALVADVLVDPDATAFEVHALRTPGGDGFLRVWVTLGRPSSTAPQIAAVLVATDRFFGDPWTVRRRHDVPLAIGSTLPPTIGFGNPPGREAPILPTGADGRLLNLQTRGQCSGLGEPSAVAVTGPGPGSYTVFAIDRQSETLRVINPLDCSEYTSAPVGLGRGPVALATLGGLRWRAVFVANRDDDTISRLDDDGTIHAPIVLAPPGGPACTKCPVALGVVPRAGCGVDGLEIVRDDADPDGTPDLQLHFDKTGCPQPDATEVVVQCKCTDDVPDCPCACDCLAPAPGCFCPGFVGGGFTASSGLGPGETLIGLAQDPIGGENPWKELGRTVNSPFVHEDAGVADQSWIYDLTLDTDPP
ncbi:MAG: hypothetical protein D6738_11155, partial [Acidobacteria bacterium]